MRVILEVISGPQSGTKTRLIAGQVLQVGRTEWADFAISSDTLMSSLHFAIEAVQGVCQLRDLGSSNGTLHNGEPVQAAVLRDGDEIKAGTTTFRAHIEGDTLDKPAIRTTTLAGHAAAPISMPARKTRLATYTAEPLGTGLVLYRGQVEQIPVSELAAALARVNPICLIVDFNRIEVPRPEGVDARYLFDWMPTAAVESSSPTLLGPGDDFHAELIDQAWGEDALVCVFSKLEKADLTGHLRAMARAGSDSVLGYCWPSVLSPLLSFYSKSFIDRFMIGIESILVEFADLPETWQIFARPGFDAVLKKAGLKEESHQPAEA